MFACVFGACSLVRSLDNLNILDEIMQQDSSHGSEEPSGKVEMDNILQAGELSCCFQCLLL